MPNMWWSFGAFLTSKTKILDVTEDPTHSHPALQLPSLTVESVQSFTYLGSEVNSQQVLEATIKERLVKAGTIFAMLSRIWQASTLPIKVKALVYNTLVRPVALYGSETWALLPGQEQQLDTADMKWVRRIAGVTLWDQLHNAEIRFRALPHCLVSWSETCRQSRLRYYGHLHQLPLDRAPGSPWIGKPQELIDRDAPSPPGTPSLRWTLPPEDSPWRSFISSPQTVISTETKSSWPTAWIGNRLDRVHGPPDDGMTVSMGLSIPTHKPDTYKEIQRAQP